VTKSNTSSVSVNKSLRQRFARLIPYFGQPKSAWIIAFFAVAIAACTEPMIPAALKPLLDRGFTKGSLQVWIIPVALIALFGVRGIAGFVAEMAVSKVTSKGLMKLRQAMFAKVLDAKFVLFAEQNSSELANTVVYEVNNGSSLLVNSLMALVRDTVTMIALVGYLLYLNWQLTTIVAVMLPAVAFIMAKLSKKLYGLSKASQKATDDLAYVVEENVLAHRDIRLHAAQPHLSPFVDENHRRVCSHEATDADDRSHCLVCYHLCSTLAKCRQWHQRGRVHRFRHRHAVIGRTY
jgi:ATP-binding cassette, subfamily B, bacterial MsbA